MRIKALKWIFIVLFLAFSILSVLIFTPLSPVSVEVEIPLHASTARICRLLSSKDVFPSYWVCRASVKLFLAEQSLKPGVYHFEKGQSIFSVMKKIISGDSRPMRFTIIEGEQFINVWEDLRAEEGIVLTNETLMQQKYPTGQLLADTYFHRYGTSADFILRTAKKNLDQVLMSLWSNRKPKLPYRNSKEALIVGSLIEKETAVSSEKDYIASVIVNRLKRGMKLQIDATVNFALNDYKRLKNSDYKVSHPYNTYKIIGLPPGPICNVSRSSLLAALHPKQTNDLFYVAAGDGSHLFASTYSEHLANIKKVHRKVRSL